MKIVGLTGGIGSGKTTVAKFFSTFDNVAIYIADVEAKKLMNSSEIIKKR
jgi:dephospho-CoA kinase